jgi:hypothetical protein
VTVNVADRSHGTIAINPLVEVVTRLWRVVSRRSMMVTFLTFTPSILVV